MIDAYCLATHARDTPGTRERASYLYEQFTSGQIERSEYEKILASDELLFESLAEDMNDMDFAAFDEPEEPHFRALSAAEKFKSGAVGESCSPRSPNGRPRTLSTVQRSDPKRSQPQPH
jgi:hypothetical protein